MQNTIAGIFIQKKHLPQENAFFSTLNIKNTSAWFEFFSLFVLICIKVFKVFLRIKKKLVLLIPRDRGHSRLPFTW